MGKIGILTFHYSNNYGGVLQALALQKVIEHMGYDVEVIDFVPSSYQPTKIIDKLGFRRNVFKNEIRNMNIFTILQKINVMKRYSRSVIDKFDKFRTSAMNLSKRANEELLKEVLNDYSTIIVGSDQIWNPSERKRPIYFLNYGDSYNGRKISYAADSTNAEVETNYVENLRKALGDFDFISVRNQHTFDFVRAMTNQEPAIVADPTVLYDFRDIAINKQQQEDYILVYVLGKEIPGKHHKALQAIKRVYGDLPVYSIKIPTMNFHLSTFADETYYDLDPIEWMTMFRNARFVYTDSFHAVLFSLKYHKPFLAYYSEKVRSTRLVDLAKRYDIERYIVTSTEEIEEKESIHVQPDFEVIDDLLEKHRQYSFEFLEKALRNSVCL